MENILKSDDRFRYMMLDRLRQDCEYYFGNGNKNPRNLWAGNEVDHINAMKDIWNSFAEEDKPEWLTLAQIEDYEARMVIDVAVVYETVKTNTIGFDSVYMDYIIELVGVSGFEILHSNKLIESCGVVNGRQLYTLLPMSVVN